MEDIVIRPSMKLIRAGYTVVFIVIFVCVLAYTNWPPLQDTSAWMLLIPASLLLWPLRHHLQRTFTRMTLSGDKLCYETGMLSRSKRTVQAAKVLDVRVRQTLVQRLLQAGDLCIETAGETGLLTMLNVDNPEQVTEAILRAAREHAEDSKARRSKA